MTIKTNNAPYGATLPIGMHVMDTARAITTLKRLKSKGVDSLDEPPTLRTEEIDTLEQVFQARTGDLNEQHLGELESAIKTQGTLDPLIVWRCGAYPFLLEGHHRLEAYRRVEIAQGKMTDIPVTWFRGSVEEAAIHAGAANSRVKLQMSNTEKSDHAWKMVKTEMFLVEQVVDASKISKRTVITMRNTLKKLGDEADQCGTWRKALATSQGMGGGWEPEEAEAMVEKLADEYAKRLRKQFSSKLVQNPDVTGRMFAKHFNRKSKDVIWQWMGEAGLTLADFAMYENEETD